MSKACVILAVLGAGVWTSVAGASWEVLPTEGRALAPLLADPLEARGRVGFMVDDETYGQLGVGGDLGLLARRRGDGLDTLSARVLVASRFEFGSGAFDLIDIDYIGALAWGIRRGRLATELSLIHQSSHLGDEMMIPPARRAAIRYHHESLRWLWAWRPHPSWRFYAGPSVRLASVPEPLRENWAAQVGCEWTGHWQQRRTYVAVDWQRRQLDRWFDDVTVQAGCELQPDALDPYHRRVFIELRDGRSTMGQFYRDHEATVTVGFAWDW